jgi:oxygen-dependent protoporphyrinogen oxidase
VPEHTPHVVVVGAGIAGLASAFFLRDEPVRVTVLEGSSRLGGKLAVSEVAGMPVDEGAEALLARRPEGADLIAAAGLADQLVPAGTTSSAVWTRGDLRPLPRRQFMGVPADIDELAASGLLSDAGVARAQKDRPVERHGDMSVADYIGGRIGQEVVDRLVDPLLGGVYAGRSEELSFEATLGPLAAATERNKESAASLAEAVTSLLPQPSQQTQPAKPVFVTLTGGLGALPDVLAKASGADVRTGAMVRELTRTPEGWRLTIGSAADPESIEADAVILAVPARPASRLLAGIAGSAQTAATDLAAIPYASMAIITLAYPKLTYPTLAALTGRSGYLVPAIDGRGVKAVTFSTTKWPHLAGDHAIVRCSVGRIGEETLLQRDDTELIALAHAELAQATGISAQPADTRVTRWGGALPQYTVGHVDRIRRIKAAVAGQPGLAVAGAVYDGVGIPACVGTARAAVDQVLASVRCSAG